MLHGCAKMLGGSSKMWLWQGRFGVTKSVQKPGGVLGIAQGAEGNQRFLAALECKVLQDGESRQD